MKEIFSQAQAITPGGVHSPVRSCSQVGMSPVFWQKAKDAWLFDINNKQYLDYVCGFGPVILGHAHPIITEALQQQASNGTIFGGCHENSNKLCEIICDALLSVDSVRLMNSGTEACSTAIRLARAATGKNKIIKCFGAYHGHGDLFLVSAGSGSLTLGQPSSPGVPIDTVRDTLLVPFNDIEAIKEQISLVNDVAAIIVEPICGNMGMILPQDNYLSELRKICNQHNILLIFDEVMTGFRVDYAGAQGFYKVKPDLTVLGKVIGGGMPVGAVGGKKDIMNLLSPVGPVYQGGTFSANPMSVAAGVACLEYLQNNQSVYNKLNQYTEKLVAKTKDIAHKYAIGLQGVQLGGMLGLFLSDIPINNLEDTKQINQQQFKQFYAKLRANNISIPPSAFEAWFVTMSHNDSELDYTLEVFDKVFKCLSES